MDSNAAIVHRESDQKTADTSGWTLSSSHPSNWGHPDADEVHWQTLILPVGATQMYLHVKLLNTSSPSQYEWGYWLSDAPGETEGTKKTVTQTNVQVRAWDIKNHRTNAETGEVTHGVGREAETVVTFGSINFEPGKATVQVTVTNPMGVQKIIWGNSESSHDQCGIHRRPEKEP